MDEKKLEILLKTIERKAGRPYDFRIIAQAQTTIKDLISRTTDATKAENKIYRMLECVANNMGAFHLAPKTIVEMMDVGELGRKSLERAQDSYRKQFTDGSITPSQAETIVRAVYLQGEYEERINQHHLDYTSSRLRPISTHVSTSRDPSNKTSRQGFT